MGQAVRAIREAKAQGDPQFAGSKFAIRALMSHGHLVNIEADRRKAPEEVIHRLAALLSVPVDAISYTVETATEAAA